MFGEVDGIGNVADAFTDVGAIDVKGFEDDISELDDDSNELEDAVVDVDVVVSLRLAVVVDGLGKTVGALLS